jgi:UDP-N-acetyl-D-mannosaminuronate dehydrogenase
MELAMENYQIRHEISKVASAIDTVIDRLKSTNDLLIESNLLQGSLEKLKEVISELDKKRN